MISMTGDAILSPCGIYRYSLTRSWFQADTPKGDKTFCLFVMLNPSTADASLDDPTIRRCVGFASRWGYRHLSVVNLFALRATDPTALYAVSPSYAIGGDNDAHIRMHAKAADLVVCAWGSHGGLRNRDREVKKILLEEAADRVMALGWTKGGQPRHPLYMSSVAEPVSARSIFAATA